MVGGSFRCAVSEINGPSRCAASPRRRRGPVASCALRRGCRLLDVRHSRGRFRLVMPLQRNDEAETFAGADACDPTGGSWRRASPIAPHLQLHSRPRRYAPAVKARLGSTEGRIRSPVLLSRGFAGTGCAGPSRCPFPTSPHRDSPLLPTGGHPSVQHVSEISGVAAVPRDRAGVTKSATPGRAASPTSRHASDLL